MNCTINVEEVVDQFVEETEMVATVDGEIENGLYMTLEGDLSNL